MVMVKIDWGGDGAHGLGVVMVNMAVMVISWAWWGLGGILVPGGRLGASHQSPFLSRAALGPPRGEG